MKLLMLDFETQGDDPKTTNPTEVGAVLFRLDEFNGLSEEKNLSQLIWDELYEPQTPEIIEITGITDKLLKAEGKDPLSVFRDEISPLVQEADYVLCHNMSFDRGIYEATCKRLGTPISTPVKGWICTIQDVPYAKKYKCKKLSHLAYDHGILVHPSTLHRAIADVRLLALLISGYKFEDILKYRDTPWAYLRAVVPAPWEDGGVGVAQAKKLGYAWEKIWGTEIEFSKKWVRRLKEDQIETEKERCPFKLMRLTAPGEETK